MKIRFIHPAIRTFQLYFLIKENEEVAVYQKRLHHIQLQQVVMFIIDNAGAG